MTLAPLATPLDAAKAGVEIAPGELDIVLVYLDVASAAVRQAAGVPISQVTSTVELEGTVSQWLRPPGVPVTSVSAVEVDDVPVTDYLLRGGQLWRAQGWSDWFTPSKVLVTCTHGLPIVPADIVNMVVRLMATALVAWRNQPDGSGMATPGSKRQETFGDYSVTYGADGRITEMSLPKGLREQLAARFGQNTTVVGSR